MTFQRHSLPINFKETNLTSTHTPRLCFHITLELRSVCLENSTLDSEPAKQYSAKVVGIPAQDFSSRRKLRLGAFPEQSSALLDSDKHINHFHWEHV